jgi:hypothetical protein
MIWGAIPCYLLTHSLGVIARVFFLEAPNE